MNRIQTQIVQWARRLLDFLAGHDLKSEIAELPALRQELDDTLAKFTADAAAQDATTRQARVQTTEIRRLRTNLRDGHIKPIVRMSRTMQLELNGSKLTFELPNFSTDNEQLARAADGMVLALNTVGPQFVARGFATNFVEQLANASKALRDAITQRSALVSRRTGTTAVMQAQANRLVQLAGVIDTLVRPVIQNDPELFATWQSLVAVPRATKVGGAVITPIAATPQAAPTPVTQPSTQAAVSNSGTSQAAPATA